eukprot:2250051-Prymnesium_polylepis.1
MPVKYLPRLWRARLDPHPYTDIQCTHGSPESAASAMISARNRNCSDRFTPPKVRRATTPGSRPAGLGEADPRAKHAEKLLHITPPTVEFMRGELSTVVNAFLEGHRHVARQCGREGDLEGPDALG